MDDQSANSRPNIPMWGWIIGVCAIIVVAQLLFNRDNNPFGGAQKGSINDVVANIEAGNIKKMSLSGNQVTVDLIEARTIGEGDKKSSTTSFVWDKEPDVSVYELLQLKGIDTELRKELLVDTPDGSFVNNLFSVGFSLLPILLIIWVFSRGFRQIQGGGGNSIFGFGRSKARNINEGDRPTVSFDDVAGVDEAKEEVQEIVQFLREPERFIQVGARIPKGVLMVGPPGTGKTLLARAIAGEAGVPFYHISGSEFVEMFVGVGASRVRDLFSKAKENAPAIVFVDEIDAVGRQRGSGLGGGHDEREQTLNQILTEMDGFDKDTNIIVIAATNRPDVLDPALMRPGRFDRKVIVDLPDVKGRDAILRVHARGKPIAKNVEYNDWARLTAGFSGADLENLVNEAAIYAARRTSSSVTKEDFQNAFDRIVIGPERKSKVLDNTTKEIIAYHEAGHAVVRYNLPNADPVQKITIVPRGRAGGFVMTLPEDRYLHTKGFFEDFIATALAGRAAEEVFFGQVTDGASSDLQQATRTARMMVTQLGFSDSLGLRTYGEQAGNIFLGRGDFNTRDYSEDAASVIDDEVKQLLENNYNRAREIIRNNHDRIVKLVKQLMEVETLDRPAFEALMNASPSLTS